MAQRRQKAVLFLCAGSRCHSRFAEALFNSAAGKMGLPWRASSRGLVPGHGSDDAGLRAASVVKALEALDARADDATSPPGEVAEDDLGRADRVVALNRAEHLPLLQERFPAWADKVEYWQVDDAPEALGLIEREVMGLIARIMTGGERQGAPAAEAPPEPPRQEASEPPKKPLTAKVGRETAGRRGKGVTTVFDLQLDEASLKDLAGTLKQRCGTGGTVKGGRIEIQGDVRERVISELERLGYKVKRAGG